MFRMKTQLTEKQKSILAAIKTFVHNNGYSPTVRELADLAGPISTAGVHKVINVLIDKGYLRKRGKGQSRSIEFIHKDLEPNKAKRYPIVGNVQAGAPELAVDALEGEIELDESWAGNGDVFFLRVKGHSMVDADIRNGDLILVEKTASCQNGDIIIALLDNEATVKRFYKEMNRFRLQPENPNMQPIYIQKDDEKFRIIGKVKGLMRKF